METRYDFVPIQARMTSEGYLVDSPVLTRTGVFEYRNPDGSIRRELRRPETVFDAAHLASIKGKPITDQHRGMISAENVRQHQIGTVLSEGRQDGANLVADIIIHDPTAVLKGGSRQLSLGYQVKIKDGPGEYNGEHYDCEQEEIICDHLAVVPRGRAGPVARLNMDEAEAAEEIQEIEMANTPAGSVRCDNVSYEVPIQVQHYLTRQDEALTAEKAKTSAETTRADRAEAQVDDLKQQLETARGEVAKVRADALAQARARLELESQATKAGATFKADASDREIREAVIRKIRGADVDLSGRSDDFVDGRFQAVMEDCARADAANASQRQAVNGHTDKPADRADTTDPLAAKIARLGTAWKGAA